MLFIEAGLPRIPVHANLSTAIISVFCKCLWMPLTSRGETRRAGEHWFVSGVWLRPIRYREEPYL